MGNSESSSSQFPNDKNPDDFEQSKKKASEEETSSGSSALKVGAAVAGTALLALGAWSLGSSVLSDSTDNEAKKTAVVNRSALTGVKPEGRSGGYAYGGPAARLIRVLSYNVWFREDVELHKRMGAIGKLIQEHSPDVIFFQEVTPLIYEIFQSSQWWNLYECSVPPERAATRKYFCMVLSKLPVNGFYNKKFDNSTMGREICMAELNAGSNKTLVVASSHLESTTPGEMNTSKRQAQARETLSFLNRFPNVVFGGDMNWDENNDGNFPLHGAWIDAWSLIKPTENGWTFDTKANRSLRGNRPLQKRLDRFICKLGDFEITDIEMIGMEAIPGISYNNKNKENPVSPSDHFGLLLTISSI